MKRSLLKPSACPTFLLGIILVCSGISVLAAAANANKTSVTGSTGTAKVRRNQSKNSTVPSSEVSMVSVDEGETVYITCPLDKSNVYGCEWYKKSPHGGNRKQITQFFDRYQRVTPCQLQIRSVTYEDAGMIICKTITDAPEPVLHANQLIVTGEDDPFGNTLLKPSSPDSWKGSVVPYSEPEIIKDLFSIDRAYKKHKGGNIVVKCEATGHPKPVVSWRRGSKVYSTPTEGYSNLKLTNLTEDDSGVYKCEAVNLFGKSVQEINLQVMGALQGSSEILDVTPRNVTLYEGNQGNVTCIARFEGDPWFGWVKKIENKSGEKTFSYEGHDYSVLPRTEIRPLGQQLFATTLLLQNVTTFHSGIYHCIVAGLQGYNHSEAYVVVEKDPSKLHMAQMRGHKVAAFAWICSFVIFAGLIILFILKVYGCPNSARGKLSSQGSLSSQSSTKKTQLPKRSPETLSTDCTHHPRHEAFDPLVTHGSCSLTTSSQEPSSLPFNGCTSSCGTYNSSDDPDFSVLSGGDSYAIADLEAARSSYSRAGSICDSEFSSSKQSATATSPRTQTSDYYTRRQSRRKQHSHRSYYHHRPHHHHHHRHLYHPVRTTSSEHNQPSHLFLPCEAPPNSCPLRTADHCGCNSNSYEPSNLSSLSSEDCGSGCHSHPSDGTQQLPHHNYNYPHHHPHHHLQFPEDDEDPAYDRHGMNVIRTELQVDGHHHHHHLNNNDKEDIRRKLNPSPNLSFLEQFRANPNTVTAIL